ncbi:phage tail length tape measure family protein [Pseudomonas saudiphocaensis]|uniref:phage tail length tape measure family protein n=1 Tax=Pseudomonas saudiphocaensis TaxID=1499686 RepID=UPI000F7817E2|nr:phage tail length tape measure family protein [Pseudomonas saudiphocaensis]RRV18128.1 tape measure domain-containing protein [Pseudomonas saudiphocaensis]
MSIKDRLIQFVLRGKDELSPAAEKSGAALDALRQEAEQLGQALDKAKDAQGLSKALQQTERAVEQTERSLVQADLQIRELRDALNANPEGAGLRQSLKEAEREARKLQRGLDTLRTSLGEQQQAAKAAGIDTDNLGDEHKRLAAETDKAKQALADNNTQLKAAQREQNAAARATAEHSSRIDTARESMSRGAKQVLAFAAAYISLNAAANLVRGGLNLVRDGIRAVIADGSSNEQALAQLESALVSTGNAAGLTAQQLLDMADEFRSASMLTTEQILAGQTRLLSYTDIVASEFPAAMQIVIDQQQRLGISVEQSAEIVGRALQSPSEAIATLGRQGFKFEEGQKRLLKQLEATGQKAEAQAVIMDMLTEAYGGAAAAARMNTFAGLLKTVGDQFGDFAGRVADSGAFDYARGKLQQLADHLDAMANDGRLDRLAQSLSDAFVNGAEAVSKYAERLATVDFEALADRAASMAAQIGPAIEQTVTSARYVTATLTTVWNVFAGTVNATAAAFLLAIQQTAGRAVLAFGQIADFFGGSEIRAKADGLYQFLGELSTSYIEQTKTDFGQVAAAWSTTTETVKTTAAEQTQAVKKEADDQFAHIVQRVTDMNNALAQIDAAEGAAQLRQLGAEMYKAYQRGDLSQQQFAAGTAKLQAKLRDIGGAATGMGAAVGIAADSLKNLADVQRAIGDAKTDRDITAITTALRRLYDNGQVGAAEYNAELAKLSARQKELKQALEGTKKAQEEKNKSDQDAIVTSEKLRRESGKRMEEERRASGEAMELRRKQSSDARANVSAVGSFVDGVMSTAREGVAGLSRAALEAFDRLRNISTAAPSIDTSGLEATRRSLEQVNRELAKVEYAALRSSSGSLAKWANETQRDSLKTQQAFLTQKSALQSLMDEYERGGIGAQSFIRRAKGMRSAMGLLDDSDLSSLESAIAAANQRMQQMGQTTRSTLESLQDELDQLEGRTDAIEGRRFAARRRELEAQLAEANASGNAQAQADAARAIGMLRQIESETAQQRQRDEQQKRIDAQQTMQSTEQQPAQASPAKVIRLEVPGRQPVDVAVNSETDETKLLGILESAGLRAL